MLAIATTMLLGLGVASPLPDKDLSRSLGLLREIASQGEIRIFAIPKEVGECWGSISSCPDVELIFTYTTGDLGDPPVAYSLPTSKGWDFVRWVDERTFVVRTSIPAANIEKANRDAWISIEYTVSVNQGGASYVTGAPN